MIRAMTDNDQGNINFDFLVGLVVFMTAFLYVINAVPGIFVPYQTNAIDLSSLAYRTSSILAEDPGWWQIDQNHYYTDWEVGSNVDHVTRLGLGVDKRTPNVLSYSKIMKMGELVADNYTDTSYKLGLMGTQSYNYTLQIWQLPTNEKDSQILNVSNNITSDSIESIDRMVLIRYGEGLFFDCYNTPDSEKALNSETLQSNLTLVKSPSFGDGNVSIRIVNFTGTAYNDSLSVAYNVGPDPDDQDSFIDAHYGDDPDPYLSFQYYVYKTNEFERYKYIEYPGDEQYNNTDIIDVVIDGTKLNNTAAGLGMNVSAIALRYHPGDITSFFPSGFINYTLYNPDYRYFDYPGIMRFRVWNG